MNLTVREEIIILTSCFGFCMFAIPIMIFNTTTIHHSNIIKIPQKTFAELEFGRKLLVDSIEILRDLNRKKKSNESLVELSDLLNVNEETFRIKYASSLVRNKNLTSKQSRRRTRNAWKKFGFFNGTILRSRSLNLPLKVDW